MRFIFYSPVNFEDWDWRNSVERGIGGSETSHVEMAWRLARRGHEVLSYAPIPPDCPGEWRGTFWKRYEEADFTQDGIWIIYRHPEILDQFGPRRPEQPRWLMCQDTWYPSLSEARASKLDRVMPLCLDHLAHLDKAHPFLGEKLWVTSNGVKVDLVRELEKKKLPPRNPTKLIYASSPDRGLLVLLDIFKRAKELVPDLTLSVFYGLNNIEKFLERGDVWAKSHFAGFKEKFAKLIDQPGVSWRGRVSQVELYREWLGSGIWCYPTDFTETSCITCMEAQALGAIPITRPLWALTDNVRHGIWLDGSPAQDPLVRARYVGEIYRLATDLALQDRLRGPMMAWARSYHNWERWVDQWESNVLGFPPLPVQFLFQHKHAVGRILNVGCATDPSRVAHRGAVNRDVVAVNPTNGEPNAAHVICDARRPLPNLLGLFDTVILGDILEHMTGRDQARTIRQASLVLKPGGRVLITVPFDTRKPGEQNPTATGSEEYTHGVGAFHANRVRKRDLYRYCDRAGLRVELEQVIDYNFADGIGLVARDVA